MSAKVLVRFGEPEHGCLPVELRHPATALRFDSSYVYPTLNQLVGALQSCLLTPGEYTATWNSEPTEFETCSRRDDSAVVTLAVYAFPDHRRSALHTAAPVLSIAGAYGDVALPFWRALRGLRARVPGSKWDAVWGHPFPDAELDRLTAALYEAGFLHGRPLTA